MYRPADEAPHWAATNNMKLNAAKTKEILINVPKLIRERELIEYTTVNY